LLQATDDNPENYTLEQAFVVRKKLKSFQTIMYLTKFFIAIFTLYTAMRALRKWHNYRTSCKWTVMAFAIRVVLTITMSWLPWYAIFFSEDMDTRPQSMNTSVRLYMDLLLNVPVITLSFVVTPGLVAGAVIVMELLPFTIVPYTIIFGAPLLGMITLWPMLSLIGHGSGNWFILYGSLIYIGYGMLTTFASFKALHSLEAFKILGKKSYKHSIKPIQQMSVKQGELTGVVPVDASPKGRATVSALSPQSPHNVGDKTLLKLPDAEGDRATKPRRSSMLTDMSKWVVDKMGRAASQNPDRDFENAVQQQEDELQGHEGDMFFDSLTLKQANKGSRRSMEMCDAVVQGTLISHLHSRMLPRMVQTYFIAKMLYLVGMLFLVYGIYQETSAIFDILMDSNLVGAFITTVIDAVVNKLMVQVCFVDIIFSGLVKMRLFNGYMADDVVLTSFCLLAGYSAELNKQFSSGAKEMKEELTEKKNSEVKKSTKSDGAERNSKRTKSMPPIAMNDSKNGADPTKMKEFLKSIQGDIEKANKDAEADDAPVKEAAVVVTMGNDPVAHTQTS
jgi:hypothetical protein